MPRCESPPVCYEEMTELLACFFDLQITSVLEILRVSSKTLAMARTESEITLREWPFNKLKASTFEMDWADIKRARAEAIETASPGMRECLFMAERKAVLMRALYMPKHQQYRVSLVPFPDEDGRPQQPLMTKPHAEVQGSPRTYRRIPALRRIEEIASILPCLIDIPIRTVTNDILGISHHALLGVRKGLGMAQWPAELVQKGGGFGVPSRQAVAQLRWDTLQRLHPQSYQARILLHARKVARDLDLQRMIMVASPPSARAPPPSPQPEPVSFVPPLFPEENDDDKALPPPQPTQPVDDWDFRWDDELNLTQEEQAYWREVCDMPPAA